jgi:CheY-like chemotaxis protein
VSIEESQVAEPPPREPREGDAVRVLIVEDNPHIIEMYSYVLKKLAANESKGKLALEVHFASEGHAALTMLLEAPFHLVMTDLYMPVMDGFQLIERMRAESKLHGIPVVAISAGGADARERAVKLGVDRFLKKPVRFAEVMDTVKQLLKLK